jgi:hypothetical protein
MSGAFTVTPTQTTTYELTASNSVATVHCSTTVTVTTPPPAAPTCILEASPTTIVQGGSSTLMWGATNATSVIVAGQQTASIHSGQVGVTPSQTTTYTMTASGPGGSVNCTATVVVTVPQTPAPVCTLSANPSSIAPGGASTLSWTTANASSVSIDQGIGSVPTNGGRTVAPGQTTTYTLTAIGQSGTTVHCSATVTVVPPATSACTLSAVPTTIVQGSAATLSWTTNNVSNVSITNVGSVSSSGSITVAPAQTTTYVLTGSGANGPVNCTATIVVVTPTPNLPACTLSANPSSIRDGDTTTLSWTTTNATSFVIDQGVGSVSTGSGSRTVYPGGSRTYVGTATGPGGSVTCVTSVSVNTSSPGPSCTMNVSPSTINRGDSATLTWDSTNVNQVRIDQGIGSVNQDGSRRVSPNDTGSITYNGTFYGNNGNTITCSATLRVRQPQQNIVLDQLPLVGEQPLSYVYLSNLPYTGLDLGPVGTAIYWLMLILWSLAVAYLVLWGMVPAGLRRFGLAGAAMTQAPAHVPPAQTPVAVNHTPSVPVMHSASPAPAPAPRTYSSYEGFKTLAAEGALTIDDIVKGLAREADDSHLLPSASHAAPATVPPAHTVREVITAPTAEVHQDVPTFLAALVAGEKDTVFGIIRDITKAGGDAQAFITHVVMALDDAYRAKTEGGVVHPDIARIVADSAPSFLEKLITSLSTAVDSTYSAGVTGVKLAVTRALNVVTG